jgi:hypothetical protein
MMVPEMNHQLLDLIFHVHLNLRVSQTIYIQYKSMRRLLINMWIEDNHGEELSKILFKDGDRYKLSRSSQNCQ